MKQVTVSVIGKISKFNTDLIPHIHIDEPHVTVKASTYKFHLKSVPYHDYAVKTQTWGRPTGSVEYEERLLWLADSDYVIVLPERGESTSIEMAVVEKFGAKVIDLCWILDPTTHKFYGYKPVDNVRFSQLRVAADNMYDAGERSSMDEYFAEYTYRACFGRENGIR